MPAALRISVRWFTHALLLFCVTVAFPTAAQEAASLPEPPHLYIIGDSTAAAYPPNRHPLTGWAQVLQDYFDPHKLLIADKARSGRSSKSFRDEGAWTHVESRLRKGDYVMIQFGHNDEKKADPKRYTEPGTTYRHYLKRYIEDTRAKGATPILLTPVNRNSWTDDGALQDTHGEYPDAVRGLAKELKVTLIDLHAQTQELFKRLGPDEAGTLFMNLKAKVWPNYPEGYTDNTHFQEQGAHAICRVVCAELARMALPLKDALLPYGPKGKPVEVVEESPAP